MPDLTFLNEYQREAVLDQSNACLVNANVGSGKTTVLITKIAYLHEVRQVPYQNMVVLTFTNKAADEIRQRLTAGPNAPAAAELPWFGTFHGIALGLLQRVLPVAELGYTRDFQVMLPEEELELAQQLILEHGLKIKYKNRLKKRIERGIDKYNDDLEQLLTLMAAAKIKQNKMTYRDLLENCCSLLGAHPELLQPDWLLVDEVQDCDNQQLEFLEQLKKPDTCLFAVGDPNQVIYSWRGSAFQIFFQLRSKYAARELSLPVNYRSTGAILSAARCFQQNGSKLEGVRETGSRIVTKNHYDPFQEADYLAGRIRELHDQGIAYDQIAVFYRLQNQYEMLEQVFTRAAIPYRLSVRQSIQDVPVLNWLIRVLRFALNPADTTAGQQALCDRQYGEGWTPRQALAKLRAETAEKRDSVLLERMSYFVSMVQTADTIGSLIEQLPQWLALDRYLRPATVSYQEDRRQVRAFLALLQKHLAKQTDHADDLHREATFSSGDMLLRGMGDFLNQATLYGMELRTGEGEQSRNGVRLMTLHASKGLEFSHVFIIGANQGLIPLNPANMDAEEEERRLFFVGMTRAKEYLEISWYTSPDSPRVMPEPSRYLRMIPPKLVAEQEDRQNHNESAVEHLQKLKRQVQAEQKKTQEPVTVQATENEIASNQPKHRIRHQKYGEGTIISEDEEKITISFDDYGEKELMKMFTILERL